MLQSWKKCQEDVQVYAMVLIVVVLKAVGTTMVMNVMIPEEVPGRYASMCSGTGGCSRGV